MQKGLLQAEALKHPVSMEGLEFIADSQWSLCQKLKDLCWKAEESALEAWS